ncbi:glycosyl hydrolase [Pseudomonas sp. PDM14]|uniref:WD40/YVTN/BNR-like repeat-containing protein n=1 Tax=Pseudomonas sp. PDM14 TaxID=2769288 RepID=UPI001784F0F7|nr:YCF48-related protein [Pseudomonas sp. PDM14]MBD9482044.1 glycosyl hydrolase [Pseudomonas sp. PDM14]
MLSLTFSWLARLAPWMVIGGLAYAAVFIKPSVESVPLDQPLVERRDLFFDGAVQGENLWVIGQNGALLSSRDAGQNWQREELPGRSNLQAITVSPEGRQVIVGNQGRIWTRVSGEDWQSLQLPVSELAGKLLSVSFIDGHFWAVGEMGALFRGDATAQDWQALGGEDDVTFNSIRAGVGGDLWITAEFGRLLRSTDQGASWTTIELGSESLRALVFSGSTGVAVGNRGEVYLSRNGGDDWQAVAHFTSEHLFDVAVHDGHWLVTGDRGALFRSDDPAGGWQAWTPAGLDKSYHSRLLDSQHGVVVIGQQLGLLREDDLQIWPQERAQ